ncbi:PREDICTED: uncharacterized protein LOC105563606 [Vollenhovia emeryi]|uniref:uncharacterized protein LOC105563606 n=1 Tax=Vollenhovia emeryi TaxID=411798 RepID=UPI0005F513A2|nr:PREDICTED: uncharacterized protein LOC105563606 [Vollenhovia emeryi]
MKQMLRMQAASNIVLKDIQQRLSKIEVAIKRRTLSPININDDCIAPFLPLTTIAVVKEFDALLKVSAEAVIQFKQFLSKTGGNNAKDNIHHILKKTLTNECSMKCSWKGLRNNFKVSNLHFIEIIKKEVTSRYVTLTETEFDNLVAEWIRFAAQRNKRDKSKETVDGNDKENIADPNHEERNSTGDGYKTSQWVLGLFPFKDRVRTGYASGCWDYLFWEQSPRWLRWTVTLGWQSLHQWDF